MRNKKNSEELENCQRQKLTLVRVKTTTYLTGTAKTRFLNDCIKRGVLESELAREIIKFHYAYIDSNNITNHKEFCELYKTLIDGNSK
jgi:hypothetical protein